MDEIEEIRKKKLKELIKMVSSKGSKPVLLNESNFENFLEQNENAVVDFYADWCMPCRYISPIIEELAKEFSGKLVFGKLNVDENQRIAVKFGISAIPTLIFFKKGKAVDQVVGAMSKKDIKAWIERNLEKDL
uniref:Thioredoxin n=1 Tax=Archaeoglobus fulgidus TaxID=2234 RepID=A0A7J2TGC3_ARCFL